MYEQFYEFKEKPFSLQPDPSYLFLGSQHSMALALLQYALLNGAPISVLSGEIGAGKTTVLRHILAQMDEELNVGLINNTHGQFGELMQWVNLAFGLPFEDKSKVALYQIFTDHLIERYAEGQRTVLIIDEAQNLDIEALEEIRLLTNINADKDQILQLVLVGQSELRQKLRRPELKQFVQRISVAYHLKPLGRDETDKYISHRLRLSGGDEEIFEAVAKRFIHHQSGGIPRLINIICETALVYGFSERKKRIDVRLVHEVVQDKLRGGLLSTPRSLELEQEDDLLLLEQSGALDEDPDENGTDNDDVDDTVISGSFPRPQEGNL